MIAAAQIVPVGLREPEALEILKALALAPVQLLAAGVVLVALTLPQGAQPRKRHTC